MNYQKTTKEQSSVLNWNYNLSVTINGITTKIIFFFFTLCQFHFLSSSENGRTDKMFHLRTCYVLEYEHLLINKKSNCLIKPIVWNFP